VAKKLSKKQWKKAGALSKQIYKALIELHHVTRTKKTSVLVDVFSSVRSKLDDKMYKQHPGIEPKDGMFYG
jgi:hypothetical protein